MALNFGNTGAKKKSYSMKGPSLYRSPLHHPEGEEGHTHPEKKKTDENIKWDDEKLTSDITTKNKKGGEDNVKTYETKGTSKGFEATKTDDDAYNDWLKNNPGGSRDDYNKKATEYRESKKKTHVKGRSEESSTESKLTPIPTLPPKTVELKTDVEMEPVKAKPYRPKRKKTKSNKPGTVVSRTLKKVGKGIKKALWKRKKRCYSRRKVRRGGTKCTI